MDPTKLDNSLKELILLLRENNETLKNIQKLFTKYDDDYLREVDRDNLDLG